MSDFEDALHAAGRMADCMVDLRDAATPPRPRFEDFLPECNTWTPGRAMRAGDMLWVDGTPRLVVASHVAEDVPDDVLLSRRLYIDEDGFIVMEDA